MISSVKIGPITYKVQPVVRLLGSNGDGGSSWLNGRILYQSAVIEIEDELPEDIRRAALLHESFHGILEQAGISDQPEPVIVALGYGVLNLLRENPALVDYLTGTAGDGLPDNEHSKSPTGRKHGESDT